MIKLIEKYEEISPLLKKYFKPNIKTNHFMTESEYQQEIINKSLYYFEGIFFLKKRKLDYRLTYMINDIKTNNKLKDILSSLELPVVTEIVKRPTDTKTDELFSYFENHGFEKILDRERMQLNEKTENIESKASNFKIRFCKIDEMEPVKNILAKYFFVHTGCIPNDNELYNDLKFENILGAFSESNNLIGILHFSSVRGSAEIRHLAVEAEMRNNGVAGLLIQKYHKEIVLKRGNLWVSANNKIAQNFYKKYGYEFDNWQSKVFILKKERM